MNIWVIKKYSDDELDKQFKNLKSGLAQFGWSSLENDFGDNCDLKELENCDYREEVEQATGWAHEAWRKTKWMLNIEKGDWVVYTNLPSYGQCVAAQVSKPYFYLMDESKFLAGMRLK